MDWALNSTAQRTSCTPRRKCATADSNAGELTRRFTLSDVHTPFPVHGMDAAMGLGKSWLSAPVLAGGIAGLLTAVGLTMIPSFVLYPIIVHGKPYNFFSSPAFVPIFFELTVLASAFTSVFSIM